MKPQVSYVISENESVIDITTDPKEALDAFRAGKEISKTTRVKIESGNTTSYLTVITEVKYKKEI